MTEELQIAIAKIEQLETTNADLMKALHYTKVKIDAVWQIVPFGSAEERTLHNVREVVDEALKNARKA